MAVADGYSAALGSIFKVRLVEAVKPSIVVALILIVLMPGSRYIGADTKRFCIVWAGCSFTEIPVFVGPEKVPSICTKSAGIDALGVGLVTLSAGIAPKAGGDTVVTGGPSPEPLTSL